ncbi:outer membrane lipoprotein carrier protein LolA [Niastella caeni]|uniref:Outer membrane lipoprotein carrier protein LolA n=1 Tax=Niastella caeni TaxID=2569763 RepID=A0A4V4H1C5_9BACT|nr:outer membrane lipoprotein carrier protein LolA [Niastella caeni]THU39926.1 outer membrane lipoprotein carrier protein LolA [Niastella caeni]
MKSLIVLISTFFITTISFCQQSDPAAKKVLDAVSAKFKTFKSVQATFTLRNEDSKGTLLGSKKGTASLKGSRYRVSVAGTGQEIFCDGANIWTYDKSANEVTITKPDPSTNTITMQKLFSNFYDKDFLYKLNGDKIVNKKAVQEIEMTPVDKTKPFHKVYLLIDKQSKTIYSTRILDKTGNVMVYTVNTMNGSVNLPDNLFVFDKNKYPGVEVIDLR